MYSIVLYVCTYVCIDQLRILIKTHKQCEYLFHSYTSWLPFELIAVAYKTGQCPGG